MSCKKQLLIFACKFRIFAVANPKGLIWIRQQVEWDCKHAERCEYGS